MRRAATKRCLGVLAVAAAAALAGPTAASATEGPRWHLTVFGPPPPVAAHVPAEPREAPRGEAGRREKQCVERKRVAEARRWAAGRAGVVSFAVLDECKRLVGDHRFRPHYSASVVKVMLMVGYLRLPGVRDDDLTAAERDMLGPMITVSDNDRANQVYGLVGEEALYELARDAEMRYFTTMPIWGGSEITAGDQARFVGRLERYVPRRHEAYAMGLLADVIGAQRWGVPRLKLPGWAVSLKGGWAPQASGGGWRVNQVALLHREDRRLSVAILTSDNPDFAYGQATIEGVGKRLLRAYRHR